jgi:DNA-binding response OmpR family regulator
LRHREQREGHRLALSSGADDYVLKPFEREAIRANQAAAGLV